MDSAILVTGATGNVGVEIVRLLRAEGRRVRAAVRDVTAARSRLGNGVEYIRFDFEDPGTYQSAFQGAEKVFLVRPPAIADVRRLIRPAVEAMVRSGARQVAFLSVMGAERNPLVPHHRIENLLRRAGVSYTFLRPSYFMQNFSTTHREMIRTSGEIGLPLGRGRLSLIDTRDIAAVAVKVLTEPGHENQAYTLTGNEAPTGDKMAATFSAALGRTIRYPNPSVREYRRKMAELGLPPAVINLTTVMYLIARLGRSATLTSEAETILGRPPITLEQFARDYASTWQ